MALKSEIVNEWNILIKSEIKEFSEVESNLEVIRSSP